MHRRWYEVLAPYFCRSWTASEALLGACRQLWGQPFTAPTYALLLHQWLLVHAGAGGVDQRLKHLNVLFSGMSPPPARDPGATLAAVCLHMPEPSCSPAQPRSRHRARRPATWQVHASCSSGTWKWDAQHSSRCMLSWQKM